MSPTTSETSSEGARSAWSEELRSAWSEIDKLRAFLRSLEWSGATLIYYDGCSADSCPSCRGLKPGQTVYDSFGGPYTFGHEDDCDLEAMVLGKKTEAKT